MTKKAFLAALAIVAGAAAQAAEPTWYRIHNRWYQNEWLGDEGGHAVCREGTGDGYLWRTDSTGGKVRLINKATGHALQAADSGIIPCAAEGAPDEAWELQTISAGWRALRSERGRYLNIEHRLGGPEADMEAKPDDQNRWSGQWELVHAAGPKPPREAPPQMVSVTSPEYGGDIGDRAKIELIAPGLKEVEVSGWRDGKFAKIGMVKLDERGAGAFDFDAKNYARGPLTLKLHGSAGEGGVQDNCWLQLYHTSGAKTGGVTKMAPPAAKGMKPLFVDDFDKPLSISRDGKDATYMSHKPGGGDFSGIPFSDFEGAANPFSQRDGLLRIRADEDKNSTGLLSSLRADGTGIVAKVPCYFECRFIAPNAVGSWPAFWVMTAETWKGGTTPVDELDVIEAYGGEGPGNPNYPGYEVTSHYWNQGPEGEKQPGLHKSVPLTSAPPFRGSSWYEEFHTYGVLIGKDETIYYCDDIEVGRHATAAVSKAQPWFFFINLAIGGISGWKKDLSRHDGHADMYVDYVRVWQGD